MTKTTPYQTIYISPGLTVAARPALGRWVVRWRWASGAERHGVWMSTQRWNLGEWIPITPQAPPEAIDAVEGWLRSHPVPVPGAAEVTP
jgi:hypothetical protein